MAVCCWARRAPAGSKSRMSSSFLPVPAKLPPHSRGTEVNGRDGIPGCPADVRDIDFMTQPPPKCSAGGG